MVYILIQRNNFFFFIPGDAADAGDAGGDGGDAGGDGE